MLCPGELGLEHGDQEPDDVRGRGLGRGHGGVLGMEPRVCTDERQNERK